MKSMMKRGIAAVLSLCMILTVFTTCIVSTYVYVESGLIVTVSTGKVLNLETAASDSSIKVCKSGYATPNGQLKINVITPSGHADAVGYLTYINITTGDTVTIYTDNYHGQVEIGGIESGEIEF